MAVTIQFNEYNTTSTGEVVATNLNLGSTNLANLNTSIYPVVAGSYTYEKWLKLQVEGSFTSFSDLKMYKSDGSYVTGEVLNYTGQATTWSTPTNSVSTDATTVLPTSEPDSANVSIGGDLSGSITASGNTTDFIVLQGSYSVNTSAGPVNEKTITFSWTES